MSGLPTEAWYTQSQSLPTLMLANSPSLWRTPHASAPTDHTIRECVAWYCLELRLVLNRTPGMGRFHSVRSAITGSIRVARRAGKNEALAATNSNVTDSAR